MACSYFLLVLVSSLVSSTFSLPANDPPKNISQARLIQTVDASSPDSYGYIKGMAVMKDQLYVHWDDLGGFAIYNISSVIKFDRMLSLPEISCVSDMASCVDCDVVYVSSFCGHRIYAIDRSGIKTSWTVSLPPSGLSVSSKSNIIVTIYLYGMIFEYTPSGELVRDVTVQSSHVKPHHAIQLDDGLFAVAHGQWAASDSHRVCTVDDEGNVVQAYGTGRGSNVGQLYQPYRLLSYDEALFVLDAGNKRVILLESSSLTYGRLLFQLSTPLQSMALSGDGSHLFVSDSQRQIYMIGPTWL